MTDYIAFILVGAGSAWGRSSDKEEAINNALKQLRGWDKYFEVYDVDVHINVIEVSGYDDVIWDDFGIHGKRTDASDYEKIDRPVEKVIRRTPPKKRKAA